MSFRSERRQRALWGVGCLFAMALVVTTAWLPAQTGKGTQPQPPIAKPVDSSVSAQGAEFFEKNIRPLLAENCYQCHAKSNNMAMGGLQLDSKEAFAKGGKQGAL